MIESNRDETIYPTHRCFDDTVDFMNDLAAAGAERDELLRYTVVHGIVVTPPDGKPSSHAWLERDGKVIDAGIYQGERIFFTIDRDEFRVTVRVWDETRYTIEEAMNLDRTLGFPPWVPEYRALCHDLDPDKQGPHEWPVAVTGVAITREIEESRYWGAVHLVCVGQEKEKSGEHR